MKNLLAGIILLALVGGGIYFLVVRTQKTSPSYNQQQEVSQETGGATQFSTPQKSAHYESNTPEHGSTLAAVPVNVVINVNFDLAKPSEIKILKDGKDYGIGETVIDDNKLTLRRNMDPNSPDGVYKVEYTACWPDKTCHDGFFEFAIDKNLKSQYEDMRGQKEVTVKMSDISFNPKDIVISKGTKVIWINDEAVTHYVNTDSHPAHTYLLEQNSKALEKGDSYSLAFNTSGIYPYHCSAHEATMKGSIIVE